MQETEIWKAIDNFTGYYEVSNLGRVKSLARPILLNDGRTINIKEKILKYNKDRSDYLRVRIGKNGKSKLMSVHRLVACAFISNFDNLREVNHKNGIKGDNRVDNLEWCDRSHNIRHAYDKLNKPILKGEQIGTSVLTEELVKELRYMKSYFTYRELEQLYDVNRGTIHYAVTRYWKHVK